MRSHSLLALAILTSCTQSSSSGDDTANPDGPPVEDGECSPMSRRTVEPQSFVAPTGLQQRITTFIDSAQSTLDIQMYLFTVNAIADRVIAAKNRGVAVRVLLDPDHEGNANIRTKLTS